MITEGHVTLPLLLLHPLPLITEGQVTFPLLLPPQPLITEANDRTLLHYYNPPPDYGRTSYISLVS